MGPVNDWNIVDLSSMLSMGYAYVNPPVQTMIKR
jgi:hypothetical protein